MSKYFDEVYSESFFGEEKKNYVLLEVAEKKIDELNFELEKFKKVNENPINIETLKVELEKYKQAFESTKTEKDRVIAEKVGKIEKYKEEAEYWRQKAEFPIEPINAAVKVINEMEEDKRKIRQIAEHLLIYCNGGEGE